MYCMCASMHACVFMKSVISARDELIAFKIWCLFSKLSEKNFQTTYERNDREYKPTIGDFWKKFDILDVVDNIAKS